jgi:hypothetical protein
LTFFVLFPELPELLFEKKTPGFFPLQLLFQLTAALLRLAQLLFEKAPGTAGFFDLPLGAGFVIADPSGSIFFNPVALRRDLFLRRPGFLQLTAHQGAALLFLRQTVFNTRHLLGMLFLSFL